MAEDQATTVARTLTRVQKMYVKDGGIHGDCTMRTVTALRNKGLFSLVIDSPNGQWGFMRLTPLGEQVQTILQGRAQKGMAHV